MLRDAVPVLVRGAVKYPRGTLSSLAEGADGGAGVANGSSRKLILAIFPTRLMRRQPSMRRQTFLHIPSGETRFRAPADKMTLTTLQIFHQSGSISGRAGLLSLPAAVCVERRGGEGEEKVGLALLSPSSSSPCLPPQVRHSSRFITKRHDNS